jgi:hypothetical protein
MTLVMHVRFTQRSNAVEIDKKKINTTSKLQWGKTANKLGKNNS